MMTALKTREKTGYALGDFACCLIWQSISVYLLYYCTNIAGVDTASAVRIISISKILDGLSDIVMGFIIDRTKSRFGKVRPYLLTMGAPLSLSAILLFSVPAGFSLHAKLIWIFVCYNLVTTVFYTALNVPYCSMHYFLTDDSKERSRLSIIRLIFAFSAQVLINGIMLSLVRALGGSTEAPAGWSRAMIVIGALAFALTQVTFWTTRERISTQSTQKVPLRASIKTVFLNPYLVLLLAVNFLAFFPTAITGSVSAYYAQYILGNVDSVAIITNAVTASQVLALIFIAPWLLNRFPTKKIFLFGALLSALSYGLSILFPRSLTGIVILNILKGIGYGTTGPMLTSMIADAIDWSEWKWNINSAGFGNAMSQCLIKFGIGFATALLGVLLDAGGFNPEAAVQTAGAESALIASYSYIPAVFYVLTFLIMLFYRLDKIYPRIASELKARREKAASAESLSK